MFSIFFEQLKMWLQILDQLCPLDLDPMAHVRKVAFWSK